MRSSHHFVIGKSHEVCQDYCASCEGFAALSDGCSVVKDRDGKQIEAHTDVGARLLVHAAIHHRRLLGFSEMAYQATQRAFEHAVLLGTGINSVSATLIVLRASARGLAGCIIGDGVLACRNKTSKQWSVYASHYDPAPYYPRYIVSGSDFNPTLSVEVVIGGDAGYGSLSNHIKLLWPHDSDMIVAMSDGAFSFTKNGASVPFDEELALRLLDFRRMGGKFMVRHLRGVLKELEQDGIVNQDDLSMIALYDGD
jgi:hypothetical protein